MNINEYLAEVQRRYEGLTGNWRIETVARSSDDVPKLLEIIARLMNFRDRDDEGAIPDALRVDLERIAGRGRGKAKVEEGG